MIEPSLHQLERDAEATRARLAGNLRTLRSPSTRNEFADALKEEAIAVRNDFVERTQAAAQTRIADWVDNLKARAAEHPAAVLAIAAGIGWRLLRDPPITTALIGFGLVSLLRGGAPSRTGLDDQAYVDRAVHNLKQQSHQVAGDVADRASVVATVATDKVREWSGEAVNAVRDTGARVLDTAVGAAASASNSLDASWQSLENDVARAAKSAGQAAADMKQTIRDQAGRLTEDVVDTASDGAARLGRAVEGWSAQAGAASRQWIGATSEGDVMVRSDTVNQLLLGAAGAAVAAAFGVALQRRMSEGVPSD